MWVKIPMPGSYNLWVNLDNVVHIAFKGIKTEIYLLQGEPIVTLDSNITEALKRYVEAKQIG
jgi:hypothetical protein